MGPGTTCFWSIAECTLHADLQVAHLGAFSLLSWMIAFINLCILCGLLHMVGKAYVSLSGLGAPTNQDYVILVCREKVFVMIPAQLRVYWVVLGGPEVSGTHRTIFEHAQNYMSWSAR